MMDVKQYGTHTDQKGRGVLLWLESCRNCKDIVQYKGHHIWECGCSVWRELGCDLRCDSDYHDTSETHSLDGQGEVWHWLEWRMTRKEADEAQIVAHSQGYARMVARYGAAKVKAAYGPPAHTRG